MTHGNRRKRSAERALPGFTLQRGWPAGEQELEEMQKYVSNFENIDDDDAASQGLGDLLDDFVLSATEVSPLLCPSLLMSFQPHWNLHCKLPVVAASWDLLSQPLKAAPFRAFHCSKPDMSSQPLRSVMRLTC